MAKRSGRPSSAQTPAPKSDKIVGSKTNKKGSATSKGASSITLSDKTISALKTKLDDFKKKYPNKDNVSLSDLKAVYRRGSGAYSGSHRPNVSRAGWSYGRTNKFLEKAAGKKVKAAYVQDDDLLKKGGKVGEEITCRNCGWHWNTNQSEAYDKYVCHKCGFDNNKYYQTASKGVLIGDLDSLTNKLLAQKIQIFIDNVKPILYYYINEDSNSLVIGLDDNYIEGAEDRLNKAAKSNMEFFDVDSLKMNNKPNEKQIEYSIKLKKEAKFGKINNMEKYTKAVKNKKPDYYEKYKGGAYLKKGGQLNPDNKSTKDFYAHKSGNAGGMLVGKRHSEGGIKAVNKSTGQPLEMEGGETVITRNAVSDNTKREFEGEMLTNRQILSKINVSGGGVSFAEGGDVPHKCACSGKQYKYGGDLLPDYHIVDMLGGQHEYFDSLLPSEAFNLMFDFTPKFEDGGTIYEEGGMIRLVSKKVPSLQEYISKNFGISKGLEKKTYKNYLFSTYSIVFDNLPTMVKNGLLMGNQKLVDKYING
jgi:hypothetical protein